MSSDDQATTEDRCSELDSLRRSRRIFPQYVVIDWDRENLVGAAYSEIIAQDIKDRYCDKVGIAPDGGGEEPRFRVTIERSEVK